MAKKTNGPSEPKPIRPRAVALALIGFVMIAAGVMDFTRHAPTQLSTSERPLEVRELIEAVSEQLAAVDASRREKNLLPLFQLRDFEMEINYVVRNSGGAKAEVVGIGTNLDTVNERVQKLHLRWDAVGSQKREIKSTIDPNSIDLSKATVIEPKSGKCPADQREAGKCE